MDNYNILSNEDFMDHELDLSWFNNIMNDDNNSDSSSDSDINQQTLSPKRTILQVKKPPLLKIQLWDRNSRQMIRSFKIINMKLSNYDV